MPTLVQGLFDRKTVTGKLLGELLELSFEGGVLAVEIRVGTDYWLGRFSSRCLSFALGRVSGRCWQIVETHDECVVCQDGHQVAVILNVGVGDVLWQRAAALDGASN